MVRPALPTISTGDVRFDCHVMVLPSDWVFDPVIGEPGPNQLTFRRAEQGYADRPARMARHRRSRVRGARPLVREGGDHARAPELQAARELLRASGAA